MPSEKWAQLPRRPRYEASGTQTLVVEIERSPDCQPSVAAVELQDLSRSGFQLRLPVPLANEEHICLRLRIETSGFTLTLPATVRWSRAAEDAWKAGCQSDQPLEWESLGELFLSEVLLRDGP